MALEGDSHSNVTSVAYTTQILLDLLTVLIHHYRTGLKVY